MAIPCQIQITCFLFPTQLRGVVSNVGRNENTIGVC